MVSVSLSLQRFNVEGIDTSRTGWSYGFDGRLAKAPKYQELEGFDKSANGLFKVHVYIDKLGFVWVNLASGGPILWEDDFGGVDEQPRLQGFRMDEYHFDHEWGMMGDYNWKTLADNYNEVCVLHVPQIIAF